MDDTVRTADPVQEIDLWAKAKLSPQSMDTFKRADGELIHDEYGWVTDLDNVAENLEFPQAFVQETWRRTYHRVIWVMPQVWGDCEMESPDPCEEEATNWWHAPDGEWLQVCSMHDPGEGTTVTVCQG